MTFEDVAQQYFDPLTQAQRVVPRYRCKILLRGTHTMFPGIGDDRSHLNANASQKPLLKLRRKNLQHPPLTKSKNAGKTGRYMQETPTYIKRKIQAKRVIASRKIFQQIPVENQEARGRTFSVPHNGWDIEPGR
jgi:hypothetical protein